MEKINSINLNAEILTTEFGMNYQGWFHVNIEKIFFALRTITEVTSPVKL